MSPVNRIKPLVDAGEPPAQKVKDAIFGHGRTLSKGVAPIMGTIIDASGFANGIHVGADIFAQVPNGVPVCPAVAVKNFTLVGLTIRNAAGNGIFLSGVDTYTLVRGKYLDNGDYATYPSCSEQRADQLQLC